MQTLFQQVHEATWYLTCPCCEPEALNYVSRAGLVELRLHHDCIDLGIPSRTWTSWTEYWQSIFQFWYVRLVCSRIMLPEDVGPNMFYVHRSAKPLHVMCAVYACHHQDTIIKLESHLITKKNRPRLMGQPTCWNMPGVRESSLTRPNFTAHLHPFRGIHSNLRPMSSLGTWAGTPSWNREVADKLKTKRGSWNNPFLGGISQLIKIRLKSRERLLDSRNTETLEVKVRVHPRLIHKHFLVLGVEKVSQPLQWWALVQYDIFSNSAVAKGFEVFPKRTGHATFGLTPRTMDLDLEIFVQVTWLINEMFVEPPDIVIGIYSSIKIWSVNTLETSHCRILIFFIWWIFIGT